MLLEAIIIAQLTTPAGSNAETQCWGSTPTSTDCQRSTPTLPHSSMQGAPAGTTIGAVPMPNCPEGWTLVLLLPANDVMYARCARELREPE